MCVAAHQTTLSVPAQNRDCGWTCVDTHRITFHFLFSHSLCDCNFTCFGEVSYLMSAQTPVLL